MYLLFIVIFILKILNINKMIVRINIDSIKLLINDVYSLF